MSTVPDAADTGQEELATVVEGTSVWQHEASNNALLQGQLVGEPLSQEALDDVPQIESNDAPAVEGAAAEDQEEWGEIVSAGDESGGMIDTARRVGNGLSSADGSVSTPDDLPSIQNSGLSSPGSRARMHSPAGSLRPFDRRFTPRLGSSPLVSPRPSSPAYLAVHSRQSSMASQLLTTPLEPEAPDAPWEVIRWTKLRKLSGQAFSELGKRKFGRPTCVAISTSIAIGTSKGMILIFDYHQTMKTVMGPGTKAVESSAVTSIAISADHSTVAGGHANGSIFTWEIARPAKPFLQIMATDRNNSSVDGHMPEAAVLHVGFLGTRHTALVSADDKGMAFSHLASRGMGAIVRSVKTTRILGRYPDPPDAPPRPKKPSSVLAFGPLPLGNMEHATDSLGLVAMMTPYLLVIVSTTPVAQTQYRVSRPKELVAHGAMSGTLAWFPAIGNPAALGETSKSKLAYCWLNVVTVLELEQVEPDENAKEGPPDLFFKPKLRWKAEESIVALQWLSQSVIAAITITQQLIIIEATSFEISDSSDLIKKHIYHVDLFSQHLSQVVEKLDEDNSAMHGVVADAFYMSFKAYKGRLFLLGFNDVSMGTPSNWADRLLAMMEHGDFIGGIRLATSYYTGEADTAIVGLPKADTERHELVTDKLLEMTSASLRYAFGQNPNATSVRASEDQLEELATACFEACLKLEDMNFLFDEVYPWYLEGGAKGIFLQLLATHIEEGQILTISPAVLKDLVNYFVDRGAHERLEELLCFLTPETMDIDQVTTLCKQYKLYDALFHVWSEALNDYTTILGTLLDVHDREMNNSDEMADISFDSGDKIFPYLSYILTGRKYPVGGLIPEKKVLRAKAEVYHFLFSGSGTARRGDSTTFPHLRSILDLDAASFLSMLNEAFEDTFLNGSTDIGEETGLTEEQRFGLSLNRQYVISILLEIMVPPRYGPEDIIYLDMFIARSLSKFPQYLLLPGSTLQKVLLELCSPPSEELAEDCQLSVEYLLSVYQPPDLPSLISVLEKPGFYRVIKSIYRNEKQYSKLLETCLKDTDSREDVFKCVDDCLRPASGLSEKQRASFRGVITDQAKEFLDTSLSQTAITLEKYAPDLHDVMLEALLADEQRQFHYLREVLEPRVEKSKRKQANSRFVERYVRLLCDYDPHHVTTYIGSLQNVDLELSKVLPALESSGVIDAAVVLLARDGQVRRAIDRLTAHLKTLGAGLLGVLSGAEDSPDIENTQEAVDDLLEGLQKYTRVGTWLCQRQSKPSTTSVPNTITTTPHKSRSSQSHLPRDAPLSPSETYWLDLIDSVVQVTRDISFTLNSEGNETESSDLDEYVPYNRSTLLAALRTLVQDTFSALLTSTATNPKASRTADYSSSPSFLHILRAFLSRASLSGPSLSNLRSVLSTIFATYSYEEGLLALANRLLDNDLFVHVDRLSELRKRGWRPRGQVCEGCGRRAWGPGVGESAWDGWLKKNKLAALEGEEGVEGAGQGTGKGKGKGKEGEDTQDEGVDGALVVFSCRHVFHRRCLQELAKKEKAEREARERDDGEEGSGKGGVADAARTAVLESGGHVCPLESAEGSRTLEEMGL